MDIYIISEAACLVYLKLFRNNTMKYILKYKEKYSN